jgi:hypothetical protein
LDFVSAFFIACGDLFKIRKNCTKFLFKKKLQPICSKGKKRFRQCIENFLAANVVRKKIAAKYFLYGRKIEISLVIGN